MDKEFLKHSPYTAESDFKGKYTASCYCGNVVFEISEEPLDGTYCHCRNCQVLHGAPFQWANIFKKTAIRFVKGLDSLKFWNTEHSKAEHILPCKVLCSNCNSPLADEGRNMWLTFPQAVRFTDGIPANWTPSCHIFYGSKTVPIRDGLPKFKGQKDKSETLPE